MRTLKEGGKCVCPVLRYYDNGRDVVCGKCNYACLTCREEGSCESCVPTVGRVLVGGRCVCAGGLVDDGVN